MDAPLYNAEILRLAATIPLTERLAQPQASVRRVSPICGSRVTVDVVLGAGGRVGRFGQEVRACALGQASASILGRHVLGLHAEDLRLAHALLHDWLKGGAALPPFLADVFPELLVLAPARKHPARHPSILLAFDASAAAAEQALAPVAGG